LHKEVVIHKRENSELKMKVEEFGKYIKRENDWVEITAKVGELEDKLIFKLRA
jgi:hypothetical protein